MMELQNTTLSVLRGTTTNGYGDKTNVGNPLYTGIPAAVVEKSKQSFDRDTQRLQTIRTSMCVVPDWADILDTDTLMDESTGNFFMIEDIQTQPSLGVSVKSD
jgi:capsular polysaccharide biosynthesis protein